MADVSKQVSGDSRCECGHYAAWHGGMGLGVPTFCKECRCRRFRSIRSSFLKALAAFFATLAGCGGVSISEPLTSADAGDSVEVGGAVDSSAPADSNPVDSGTLYREDHDGAATLDAGAPELAPQGPPPCPGATGTVAATACRDVAAGRCATNCVDTSGRGQIACVEPGAPWTGGIPVLCVASCGDCP